MSNWLTESNHRPTRLPIAKFVIRKEPKKIHGQNENDIVYDISIAQEK